MSYLHYLSLFVYISVQHILCCVFGLFVFVLCTLCCQFFLDCPFLIALRLVYAMLPVSLDCPFLIASSVFSNIYLP
jgi:hypothetical protein